MLALKEMKDNQFDLAIVDPPYGIGMDGGNVGYKGFNNFKKKGWDKTKPEDFYFIELFRVSVNQIIWGGNYFVEHLYNSQGWIFWFKQTGMTFADGELAWTSFDKNTRKYKRDPLAKGDYKGKIHPTQKPVKLYEWLLMNYAKEGDKILDTHLGSGSIAIACHNLGYDLEGYELDTEYYEAAKKRLKEHQSQTRMF